MRRLHNCYIMVQETNTVENISLNVGSNAFLFVPRSKTRVSNFGPKPVTFCCLQVHAPAARGRRRPHASGPPAARIEGPGSVRTGIWAAPQMLKRRSASTVASVPDVKQTTRAHGFNHATVNATSARAPVRPATDMNDSVPPWQYAAVSRTAGKRFNARALAGAT